MNEPSSRVATRPDGEHARGDPSRADSRADPSRDEPPREGRRWLEAIAIFRIVKAAVLIAVAIGAFALVGRDPAALAERLVDWSNLSRESQVVQALLEKVPGLTPRVLKAIGGGAIAYAVLFLVEAYGLLRGRVWAEWLTIVATSSFIPIEIVESIREFHVWKVATLIANVAIVGYLVARRVRASRGHALGAARG